MCGISSLINLDGRPASSRLIQRMNEAAPHRGPDGVGLSSHGAVGLGHTRLSIIDIGVRASQPMSRLGGHIAFNGEIYNYADIRSELIGKGHQFSTASDTEVLLLALLEWGLSALDRICGMFAFVFFNEHSNQVWAVRDRFGIKPLVYARVGETLFFASEAKQILATGLVDPVLNVDVAAAYLQTGALNQGVPTFFTGIDEIRAGEVAVVDLTRGQIDVSSWYRLSERFEPMAVGYADAVQGVRERLANSIRRHHVSDVPLGACLSGGIDSSTIVSLSRTLFPGKHLSAISIFSRHEGYDERRFSRAVAEQAAVTAIEIEASTERIWDAELLEELGYYQDQPLPGGSHLNEYLVFKAARENELSVMLDGQGADEYFGGYGEFWFAAQCDLLRAGRISAFLAGLGANASTMKRSAKSELISFVRALRAGGKPRPMAIGPVRCPWLRVGGESNASTVRQFIPLALEEINTSSIPYQLHSQDRNSMRWSVESRVPFLDHELVEYVMGLPTHYKVGDGFRKRILRDAVPELPQMIAKRKDKVGFASPDALALRGKVDEVRQSLRVASRELADLVDGDVLSKAYEAMVRDFSWYDPVFLRIIGLDAWRRAHHVNI